MEVCLLFHVGRNLLIRYNYITAFYLIIQEIRRIVQLSGGKFVREYYISFASASQIRDFVTLATRQPCQVRIQREGYDTTATSIMGIFGMGLHTLLRVVAPDVPEMADFFAALSVYGRQPA